MIPAPGLEVTELFATPPVAHFLRHLPAARDGA